MFSSGEEEFAPLFRDRRDAGRRMAERLSEFRERPDVLVLALPRGGVPVAFELARELKLPMDVFVVRKLGVPWQPELAMGAVASGGIRVLNQNLVHSLHVSEADVAEVTARELASVRERERLFRGERPAPQIAGRTVLIVDDGLATGSSMRAAIAALQQQHPARIVVATPVGSATTCNELSQPGVTVTCMATPEPFWAVGQWYEDFSATTDEEVQELLAEARRQEGPQAA
ncbi:MAG: phosphoribosyltransferase [Candidatus Korobacteraceae bacterium]